MGDIGPKFYRFGPFQIDTEQRLLFRAGDLVALTPKAFDTLAVLVERQGKVVDKAELLKLVWPDTFVEENNLTQNISALRKVFGEEGYIETVPRRGYRFLMPLEIVAAVPERGTTTQPKLRPVWIWAAAAVVTVIILYAVDKTRSASAPTYHVDSLVVLPFANLTASSEDDYFSDGLTEELTNAVAHLDGIRVVARTTAFQFKGKALDIRQIAQQLRVGTVLEGSVRRQENKLRVTVQLNDAQSGYHIWSQTYDRDVGDIFSIQADISNQVARTIRPNSQLALGTAKSRDPEAYNAFLMGGFHCRKPDQASVKRAIAFFQQAIDKDPKYAAAYAGLAACNMKMAMENFIPPVEAWRIAQNAVDRALILDDNLSDAHTTQAIIHLLVGRDWDSAEPQFRRAIALNENNPEAHHWFSHYLLAMGRVNESLAESQRALQLDPLNVQISCHLIFHYLRAREFPNAIQAGQETLELDPSSQLAQLFLTWAYEDTAQWDKAIDAVQRADSSHPEEATFRAAMQSDGPEGYWRTRLAFLLKQEKPENYTLAVYYSRLGEADKALARLELSLQNREPDLIYLRREPAFDRLQENPRFRALTAALRLP